MTQTDESIAAEELFRRHARFVARFLVRYGVPFDEIEDVLQDVFLLVHARGGYRPGPARPTSFLAAFAVRVASNHRRRKQSRSFQSPDSPAVAQASHTDDIAFRVDLDAHMRRLHAALQLLDPDQRAAFILFELEGESCESIAAAQGVAKGTVHSRLHYARRRLREALMQSGISEPVVLAGANR